MSNGAKLTKNSGERLMAPGRIATSITSKLPLLNSLEIPLRLIPTINKINSSIQISINSQLIKGSNLTIATLISTIKDIKRTSKTSTKRDRGKEKSIRGEMAMTSMQQALGIKISNLWFTCFGA